MSTKVAVITAIYDGYDSLRPVLPQNGDYDIEWICVTDTLAVVAEPRGWEVLFEPRPGVHPNLAAKRPKMLPWRYTDAENVIWIDASFRIVNPNFVHEALLYANPFAQFVHPERDCLYDEAKLSERMPYKYGGHPFKTMLERYSSWGHPQHWGLWATGVSARKYSPEMREFGRRWLDECEQYSFQDQVSQPAVLNQFGLYPIAFPGSPYQNPWIEFQGSGRH